MNVRIITVLGAGTMGHGVAHAAASSGFATRLYDVSETQAAGARVAIEAILRKAVELGKLTSAEADASVARLTTTTDVTGALADTDLVIETGPERMDIKLDMFAAIEAHAPPTAIVASNTSALSITEMAGTLKVPSRVAGMHFFNPVHKMKLVEVVRALESSEQTLETIEAVARQMCKETVLVSEAPGFITTRVNASIGNEAFFMLMEGVASARDIDKALKLGLNHPMGPFELVDLVGLDTRLNILEYLHKSLGEKYRPCPLLTQYVRAGRLGKKVGKGVYEY